MAIQQYSITGYSVVELTHVAALKTGRIEAQLPLNSTDFASTNAENGMLLKVDRVAGSVDLPDAVTDGGIYLHYSEEKNYSVDSLGLNKFSLPYSATLYPRMYALEVGDTFITNGIVYSDSSYADDDAVDTLLAAIASTTVYGIPSTTGRIQLVEAAALASAKTQLKVIAVTTLPDGNWAVEFEVLKNDAA